MFGLRETPLAEPHGTLPQDLGGRVVFLYPVNPWERPNLLERLKGRVRAVMGIADEAPEEPAERAAHGDAAFDAEHRAMGLLLYICWADPEIEWSEVVPAHEVEALSDEDLARLGEQCRNVLWSRVAQGLGIRPTVRGGDDVLGTPSVIRAVYLHVQGGYLDPLGGKRAPQEPS